MSTISRADYMQLMRKHARSPQAWALEANTDYWLYPSANGMLVAGSAHELADYGWTATALALVDGSGADLLSPADVGIPGHILTDATGDLLASPAIFGDYSHALMAQKLCGLRSLPRTLELEAWAQWTVASAAENQSAFGFYEDGAVVSVQADQLAVVVSDGVNFRLISGQDAVGDAGPAIDLNPHLWRIQLNVAEQTAKWWVDGVYQGSVVLEADEFPCKFGLHVLATNRLRLGWVHIYYDW